MPKSPTFSCQWHDLPRHIYNLHIYSMGTSLINDGWLMISSGILLYPFSPQTVWPRWGVLTVTIKARCSIEVVSEASGIFPVNFCTKCLLWRVHVHFDCAGSHKMLAAGYVYGISPLNFHKMSLVFLFMPMCISTAQARTKCASRSWEQSSSSTPPSSISSSSPPPPQHPHHCLPLITIIITTTIIITIIIITTTTIIIIIIAIINIDIIMTIFNTTFIINIIMTIFNITFIINIIMTIFNITFIINIIININIILNIIININIAINTLIHDLFTPPTLFGVSCRDNTLPSLYRDDHHPWGGNLALAAESHVGLSQMERLKTRYRPTCAFPQPIFRWGSQLPCGFSPATFLK